MQPGRVTSLPRCCRWEERVLGAEHPETLIARGNLARLTGEAGDAAAARDQFAALLPVEERVLGPGHRYTLTARSDLAYWTGQAGDAAAARDQFAELLPLSTSGSLVLSTPIPWPPSAATSPTGPERLGMRLRPATSIAALQPVYERVLGPEHPNTLEARHDLAGWTGFAGDRAAARDQLAALLPIRERVLGPEHPDTLDARRNSPAGPSRRSTAIRRA